MALPPIVVWLDPGKITGVAAYTTQLNGGQFFAHEYDFYTTGRALEDVCCRNRDGSLWLGWETFKIFPGTPAADAHHAIEMIGVARFTAMHHGVRILTPADPDQRKVGSPAKLKALGWWKPGMKDAQSAAQHLLAYMMRTNNLPPREAGILATMGD